ncbi:MAG: hypothetical protein KDK36_03855 [Leptospiraceae bacterium]|nr:hypothetical protein [Leptospiraceae bacterium]
MKNIMISFIILMVTSFTSISAEKLSCDDLTDIANTLDEVSAALKSAGKIEEDSEPDKALRDILDALHQLVKAEKGEKALAANVKSMEKAWQAMNWKAFRQSLDRVIGSIDKINHRDCD